MLASVKIPHFAEGSPTGLLGDGRSSKCERAAMVPDCGMCCVRPRKLLQVACQSFVQDRVCLKCENLAIHSSLVRCRDSVVADVAANVKIYVARFDQRVQTGSDVWFIGSSPHLPLDSIAQVRFEPDTRPRRRHCPVSTDPPSKSAEPVY